MTSVKIKEFMNYFMLYGEIVKRDFKKKYYRSVLGVVWSMLNPLLMMILITVVFSTLFNRSIEYYPAYYFAGNLIFAFVTDGAGASMNSMVNNASLIKKMRVPKYIFCLSDVTLRFITNIISMIPYIIVSISIGVPFSFYWLLIPIPLIYAFVFTLGFGMLLCSYGTRFGDLTHLYSVIKRAWMYFTPLFYPIDIIPSNFLFIWELNPLYIFIDIFRDLTLNQTMPSERMLIIGAVYSILMLALGIVVFKEKEDQFFLYI